MISSFVITNELGEKLELIGSNFCYIIGCDGLNPPTATISQSNVIGSDFSILGNARVYSRNIILKLKIRKPIEYHRRQLYKFFTPKTHITISISASQSYEIDGIVESFENDHFTNSQRPQISIICPQPFFQEGSPSIVSKTVVSRKFEVTNQGTVPTGMLIEFYTKSGTAFPLTIENVTTNQKFIITDKDYTEGTYLINSIGTERTLKVEVAAGNGAIKNMIKAVDLSSEWLQLAVGKNEFKISGEGLTDEKIVIKYYRTYGGI